LTLRTVAFKGVSTLEDDQSRIRLKLSGCDALPIGSP
jgi:hypothetical protein